MAEGTTSITATLSGITSPAQVLTVDTSMKRRALTTQSINMNPLPLQSSIKLDYPQIKNKTAQNLVVNQSGALVMVAGDTLIVDVRNDAPYSHFSLTDIKEQVGLKTDDNFTIGKAYVSTKGQVFVIAHSKSKPSLLLHFNVTENKWEDFYPDNTKNYTFIDVVQVDDGTTYVLAAYDKNDRTFCTVLRKNFGNWLVYVPGGSDLIKSIYAVDDGSRIFIILNDKIRDITDAGHDFVLIRGNFIGLKSITNKDLYAVARDGKIYRVGINDIGDIKNGTAVKVREVAATVAAASFGGQANSFSVIQGKGKDNNGNSVDKDYVFVATDTGLFVVSSQIDQDLWSVTPLLSDKLSEVSSSVDANGSLYVYYIKTADSLFYSLDLTDRL